MVSSNKTLYQLFLRTSLLQARLFQHLLQLSRSKYTFGTFFYSTGNQRPVSNKAVNCILCALANSVLQI